MSLKKWLIGIGIILGVGTIAISAMSIDKAINDKELGKKLKNEDALLIGCYKETAYKESTEKRNNRLIIRVLNKGEEVYKYSYVTNDRTRFIEESTISNMVFIDLTEDMKEITNDLGVYYWLKSSPTNRIYAQVEFLGVTPYLSEPYLINDCGLWAINTPTKNGEVTQVSHSYIYQENKYIWW